MDKYMLSHNLSSRQKGESLHTTAFAFTLPPSRRHKDRGSSKLRLKKHDEDDQHKNDCRHCKKFGRIKPHPYVSESACNWNKKSKSWRPEWVCKKMKINYAKRSKFSSSNGCYPISSEESDGWRCGDLDEESILDDDWTVVTRKNKRNATYYVHINKMYTHLPIFRPL